MNDDIFTYRQELPADDAAIEKLTADVFGPGRYARSAFRLREGVPHDMNLSLVAETGGRLAASVRLTPISIAGQAGLLLGPLVVEPAYKGRGAGKALVRRSLAVARQAGHRLVLLVGDEPYYGPLGFARIPPESLTLPGPADPSRVLVASLAPNAAVGLKGRVERAPG